MTSSTSFNLVTLKDSNVLTKNSTWGLLPYIATSCASVANDDSWLKPLKLRLLSPQKIDFSVSRSQLKANEKCYFDEEAGLKISIAEGEKEVIIAFGALGSQSSEVGERQRKIISLIQYTTAATNLIGFSNEIYEKAAQFVTDFSKLEQFRNKKIVIVGQSLGGSLAQYVGIKTQFTTYCFNPIPLGRSQIQKLKHGHKKIEDKNICVISTEGDYATTIAENKLSSIARWVVQAPELFGKKLKIPSAYSNFYDNHAYFMGSVMHYLGYDIRTKYDVTPLYEFCIGNRNEELLNLAITEIEGLVKNLKGLQNHLNENDKDKAIELLQLLKNDFSYFFGYLSFLVWEANGEKDLGDCWYGEHRLLNTPSVLSQMNVGGTPILDVLIDHFNTLLLIQNAKKSLAGLSEKIDSMEYLQRLQKAASTLSHLKEAFQTYFRLHPDSEKKQRENSSTSGPDQLIEQMEELEVFFSLANLQRFQKNHFRQDHDDLNVSSRKAISPDRLIENIPAAEESSASKRVYMVAAECIGVIKVGGLAEAVRGIAGGLKSQGHQVTLIMPKYDVFPNDRDGKVKNGLELTPHEIKHRFGNVEKTDRIWRSMIDDIEVLFIEDTPKDGQNATDHFSLKDNSLYEIPGDVHATKMKDRFAYFGQAAAELIKTLSEQIDIVFFHDWHGALAIPLLARKSTDEWIEGAIPPLVYVFHNNGKSAQGELEAKNHSSVLEHVHLPAEYLNIAKESIGIADHIVTVSEGYALEVQGREGRGLEKEMRAIAQQGKFTGITNGCNLSLFDPAIDKQLANWIDPITREKMPLNFGSNSNVLESKKIVKQQLQNWLIVHHPEIIEKYGVDVRKDEVMLFLSRFDASQKGLDKLRLAMRDAAEKGATFIVMGNKENSPEASQILDELEKEAESLKNPGKWGGAWIIRDTDNLDWQNGSNKEGVGVPGIGSLVRAAANILFCSSEYEPCGLTHLEGFAFAQLAVATSVGGFADIIRQDPQDPRFNGFLFPRFDDWKSKQQDDAILETVLTALDYRNQLDDDHKNALMQKLIKMSKKYSWTTSPEGLSPAEKYVLVILAAIKQAQKRGATETLRHVFLRSTT
jgi:glycogen synthase